MGVWVFCAVLVAQLALVAACGTDIPLDDQWGIEGGWLYPAWHDGTLTADGLLQAFNEHRILWTHLLNLGLFTLNGQWDPLVQLFAIAILRAACAAGLVWAVGKELPLRGRVAVAVVVALAFLPLLSWHNVLWGIESHAYFALGFSVIALRLLGAEETTPRRVAAGAVAGIAGLFAMGPAGLVPVALIGLALLRIVEQRRVGWRNLGVAAMLLALALMLRADVPEHATLRAQGLGEFVAAAALVLAWPHTQAPLAAFVVNAPLLLLLALRLARRRAPAFGEEFVVLLAGWSVAIALATAWTRGGSAELAAGLPSRYVDFIVLLPLANVWSAVTLAREANEKRRRMAGLVAGAWSVFLFVGWLGLSAEVMRGIVLPRARDREAPVRLMRAFQASGDPAVYSGQPRLLVPAPNLAGVQAVIDDPRMKGALPPSMQPEEPKGPLSRAVRFVLGQSQDEG